MLTQYTAAAKWGDWQRRLVTDKEVRDRCELPPPHPPPCSRPQEDGTAVRCCFFCVSLALPSLFSRSLTMSDALMKSRGSAHPTGLFFQFFLKKKKKKNGAKHEQGTGAVGCWSLSRRFNWKFNWKSYRHPSLFTIHLTR